MSKSEQEYKPKVKLYSVSEMTRFIMTSDDSNLNAVNNIEDYLYDNVKNYTSAQLSPLFTLLNSRRERIKLKLKNG